MRSPKQLIRTMIARRKVAERFQGGSYAFRGSSGETLLRGRIRSRWFSIDLLPAQVFRSGSVHRVDLLTAEGELALSQKQKPFLVSKRYEFSGKRFVFP